MVKTCPICGHTAELTWRNNEYHCAACDSVVSEQAPQATSYAEPQAGTVVNNVTCPICKNRDNNRFIGAKYRCSLCGTTFEKEEYQETYYQPYSGGYARAQQIEELTKEKKRNTTIGIILLFVFWPVGVYFLYKAHQNEKEIKSLKY